MIDFNLASAHLRGADENLSDPVGISTSKGAPEEGVVEAEVRIDSVM